MPRARLRLPTLLWQILVGLTIGLDNEFERRTHQVTTMGAGGGSYRRDRGWSRGRCRPTS